MNGAQVGVFKQMHQESLCGLEGCAGDMAGGREGVSKRERGPYPVRLLAMGGAKVGTPPPPSALGYPLHADGGWN